jgi:hypothetical protein
VALTLAVAGLGAGQAGAALPPPRLPDFSAGGRAGDALAADWRAISREFERAGEQATAAQGEDQELVDAGGRDSGLRWRFSLKMRRPTVAFTLGAPPGFETLDARSVGFGFPLDSGWRFKLSGKIKGRATVKAGDNTLFSWSPSLSYSLTLPRIHLLQQLDIDTSDPARPVVRGSRVDARGDLDGGGVFGALKPKLRFGQVDGAPALIWGVSDKIGLPDVNARLEGTMSLSFKPTGAIDRDLTPEADVGLAANDPFDISVTNWMQARLRFTGKVSFKLSRVARKKASFRLRFGFPLPSQRELNNVLTILAGFSNLSLPRRWGENPPPAYRVPSPPPGVDYAQAARDLEASIGPHIPNGILHTIVDRDKYTLEGDAALHTGEYLAAEAFRHATTRDPAALARVNEVLGGIERLFWVTEDAAVFKGKIAPNRLGPGLLARTAAPEFPPARRGLPARGIRFSKGPLSRRRCHYMHPEGGWTVTVGRMRRHADTYAAARQAASRLQRTPAGQGREPRFDPQGTVWYGFGCGPDHDKDRPVSRDQYTGVFFGLGLAYRLVDDSATRDRIRALVRKALGYLRGNNWRILVPFEDNGEKTKVLGSENFFFTPDRQASFMRVGATADPDRYLVPYSAVALPLAAPTWAAQLFSGLDPLHQSYKFNLSHQGLGSLLFLENGEAIKQAYLPAFEVLRGYTAHHKNPYFHLLYVLGLPEALRGDALAEPAPSNAGITLSAEVRSLLADWLVRRDAQKGPNLGPYAMISQAGAAEQLDILRRGDAAIYTLIDLKPRCLAKWAPMPHQRVGYSRDFLWEQHPFPLGVGRSDCSSQPNVTTASIREKSGKATREGAGVDYLLPYWMGVYLGVFPKP